MKQLLVFTLVFGFCFFGSTVALQCYQCKDITLNTKCEEIIIKACGPEFGYCGTISWQKISGETIVKKNCFPKRQDVFKIGETVEADLDPQQKRDHCYVARITCVTVRTNFTMETFCSQQSCWVVSTVQLVGYSTERFFDLGIKNFLLLHEQV